MDPLSLVIVFAAGLGLGVVLWRGAATAQQPPHPVVALPARRPQQIKPPTAPATLPQPDPLLYDYGREVEERIESQLTTLDRLILEADREIARLEGILAESRLELSSDRALTSAEQQRCFALWEAGLTHQDIARCLNTSIAQVEDALNEWRRPDRRAA